jgi:hypothetical protein
MSRVALAPSRSDASLRAPLTGAGTTGHCPAGREECTFGHHRSPRSPARRRSQVTARSEQQPGGDAGEQRGNRRRARDDSCPVCYGWRGRVTSAAGLRGRRMCPSRGASRPGLRQRAGRRLCGRCCGRRRRSAGAWSRWGSGAVAGSSRTRSACAGSPRSAGRAAGQSHDPRSCAEHNRP